VPVPNVAEWHIRINHQKASLTNVVITDHLSEGAGNETYILGSFRLRRVTMTSTGSVSEVHETDETANLSGRLTIATDGKSFTLNLGNIDGTQYRLSYRTTYTPGTKLRNNMTLTSTEQTKMISGSHQAASSGGEGTGDLANKIKIVKVDAEDSSIPLAGVVFEVERPDGTTFELTTGADGTVTSGTLTSGTYKVREKTPLTGYVPNSTVYTLVVSSEAGAVLNVANEPIRTSVSVTKAWVGPVGGPVTVRLFADGEDTGKTLELSAANGWTDTFTGLRQYNPDGTEIVYTIEEIEIENYSSAIIGGAANGFTIINATTETIDISGAKTWGDANDQDGVRPGSITVRLFADGTEVASTTVTSADNWAFSFPGRFKYNADGSEIVYTVTEDAVENYSTTIDGYAITNTYTPGKTSVTVVKEWDDANDQDGKRPGTIMVQLYANGEPSGDAVELSDGNQWTYTWTELDQKANGQDIVYTVEEVEVPEGYSSDTTGDAVSGYTITNTYTPETIDIYVGKIWYGPVGAEVTVILLAGGEEIARMTLSEANGWEDAFEGLPKYKDGTEIGYTIEEFDIENYDSAITGSAEEGFIITNTNTETVDINVEKIWVGPEGIEVTVLLRANGVITGNTLTLNAENGWQGTFVGLPKYEYEGGGEIVYTIEELEIENYASAITGSAEEGFTVTNTNTETVDIYVGKVWYGQPGTEVEVGLLADGRDTGRTVALNAANGWYGVFAGLPKYDVLTGEPIAYTVTEAQVSGVDADRYITFVSSPEEGYFEIVNVELIGIDVEKVWVGPKGTEITVSLRANGELTGDTLDLSEANGWRGTFVGLPKYDVLTGEPIGYTIEELDIDNYTSAITGNAETGFTVTNTNTETVDIGVVKKWVGTPAASATVQLRADGRVVAEATLTASSGWAHTFAGLPRYDPGTGEPIAYTLTETPIPGYRTAIAGDAASGFAVTNTREIPPGVPGTGDGRNPLLWSSLALAGLLMAAAARLRGWMRDM